MGSSCAWFSQLRWPLLTLALAACASSASWATLHVAPSYQPPRTVTLKVSDASAHGEIMTLEMALVDELGKRDIHATPLDDENTRPTLHVVIEKWAPGSEGGRRFLSLFNLGGLGEGEIDVRVEAVGGDGKPVIRGTLQGWVDQTPERGLRAIADRIASIVATGGMTSGPSPDTHHTGYP
jgi:hypothetical protein